MFLILKSAPVRSCNSIINYYIFQGDKDKKHLSGGQRARCRSWRLPNVWSEQCHNREVAGAPFEGWRAAFVILAMFSLLLWLWHYLVFTGCLKKWVLPIDHLQILLVVGRNTSDFRGKSSCIILAMEFHCQESLMPSVKLGPEGHTGSGKQKVRKQ